MRKVNSKTATIDDVANEAGVSITTVSRVINNNYPVKEETRKKVETAIQNLQFTPNVLARGLISNKTYSIGVIIPSITNLYFSAIVNGAQEFLADLTPGYQILLCDSGGDAEQEYYHIQRLMERRVDGIISVDPRTANIKSEKYSDIAKTLPLILINAYHDGMKLNYVLNDQESGTEQALEYLIKLSHRNIAFVRGRHSYSYDLKEEVYKKTLEENGIPFNLDNIIVISSGNTVQTVDLTIDAVQKRFSIKDKKDLPTAIFACNDWMGIGALHAAQKMNIDVPKQLSVIGFDNTILSQLCLPKLTTVDQNMRKLGLVAAENLYRMITAPETGGYSITTLETTLVIRESCAEASK